MRSLLVVLLSCLLAGATAGPVETKFDFQRVVRRNGLFSLDVVDQLEEATMPKVEEWMETKPTKNNCTLQNAAVRREWSDLTVPEREDYIKAVLCLMKQPSRAPKPQIPGALSRFDDFVAYHMTNAGMLHDTTHLLASHRYFIWAYEQALRNECGYQGYQPYMNYERYQDPTHTGLFNGNMSSMGGQGEPNSYTGVPQFGFKAPYNIIPAAGGGGCVKAGPFKDMVVSLGPRSTIVNGVPKNPRADGLGSNPRCLRRDVNRYSAAGAAANYTYSLIMDNKDINGFYNRYLGQPPMRNDPHPWGLHTSGHYIIGGDPGGDFYCSPGDPAFYFHHGALDRVWWIWQMQDPARRVQQVPGELPMAGAGGRTSRLAQAMNVMPLSEGRPAEEKRAGQGLRVRTTNALGESIIDLAWIAPVTTVKDVNDVLGGVGGQLCYIYV